MRVWDSGMLKKRASRCRVEREREREREREPCVKACSIY